MYQSNEWYLRRIDMMKKRFISIMLILCALVTLLQVPVSAETVNALYRVTSSRAEFSPQPGGTPVGIIPVWTNVEIMSIEGDYAKFSYKGYNYYTKVRNLENLDEPDYICSSWALNAVEAYVTTHGNSDPSSYKKPITRAEMAAMLVDDIMTKIRGWFQVWQTLPGVISDSRVDQLMTKEDNANTYWFQISRLLY